MAFYNGDIDITRNIRVIEWLKTELLGEITSLFRALANGMKDEVHEKAADAISNMIMICYLLARRLGVTYNAVDMKIENKIKLGIIEEHEVEKWYGDLSELSRHLYGKKNKKNF